MRSPRLIILLVCSLIVACGGNGSGDDDGGDDDGTGTDAPIDSPPIVPPGCDMNSNVECNNCLDDDNDGTIDSFDIECTSAIDDDEGSFATGIPGDNMDATWQDCFFDGNSGGGDDGCRFNTCCLTRPTDPACEAENGGPCTATQECRDNCAPLVPPNCDCFGCCTFCDGAGCVDIVVNPAIAPNCDGDVIHDPNLCPVCVKSTACGTVCEGTTECGETQPCGTGEYCLEGCCVIVPG
jgi:hypothetical protein